MGFIFWPLNIIKQYIKKTYTETIKGSNTVFTNIVKTKQERGEKMLYAYLLVHINSKT